MTGFGDASGSDTGSVYSVEVRSVNNKFLKIGTRIPERLASLEPEIEQVVRATLSRGSVTVTVSCTDTDESAAQDINIGALRKYAEQISKATGVAIDAIGVGELVMLPGVLCPPGDSETRLQRARDGIIPLVKLSLEHLIAMRSREGIALHDDLAGHLDFIAERLAQINEFAPGVVGDYEKRLKVRMESLISDSGAEIDHGDLIREIAVYAEKTDIAEEISRLGEHLIHFRDMLGDESGRPIGRTMDFLAQELLREANTIASKSPDAKMSRLIVEIKGAIDRIKEQVQNVE
ncbi:MAG: YicC family protein [Phycisphaerae bacterium]|nr:YicC family protein [Phycisphaerae bacterium]MBM90795.1 YicC family protein [Phycisphaerae bacterium]HCT45057.1 YicC family protein [Phycisphaerales bacterium]|tara:strand:- start:152 stop:1024 length:873 start_codon:yes stop_codon:yes gene_type:complete